MYDKRIRTAVLGAGRQGQIHAPNLAFRIPEAQLVCVADVSEEILDKISIEGIYRTSNIQEVFDDSSIQAVVIATATDTHAQLLEDACKAGKHIFCEKPISLEMSVINRMLDRIDTSGVQFMIGFNRRFDPSYQRVKGMIEAGELGDLRIINVTARDPWPLVWNSGTLSYLDASGGIFFDTAVHDFDIVRFLSSEEIVEVYARGSVLTDPVFKEHGDVDTTMISFRTESGAVGSINNARNVSWGYDQRVEVLGSKGCALAHNERPTNVEIFNDTGSHRDKPLFFNMERYPESFCGEMDAFIKALYYKKPMPVTGRDARQSVLLSMATKKSYEENRSVRLDEDWLK